ncbi:MAG TPA: multiheme c-type cytochrome, partial [Novimethylophilus sp.]|uniref:multiheme c-type cytochrome n=1 Tax=Novimethylophilus sp. TaxID=2137426 RepID=UPI002F40B255
MFFNIWLAVAVTALMLGNPAGAATSNVRNTLHNLSTSGTGSIKATDGQTQVCVFCHTPHNASTAVNGPLWNRNTSGSTYTRYTSSSLDANTIANGFTAQPAGSSLLCLSCHDGMVALGNVRVLNGQTNAAIAINGSTTTKMPDGSVANTGFSRNLGTDLTNDHPISVTYNDALATADGEMRHLDASQRYPAGAPAPGTSSVIGLRSSGVKPLLPLQATGVGGLGQVQCATCHDPHITNQKFLRLNRFQTTAPPAGGEFIQANDIICLACHSKMGTEWSNSVHANSTTADEVYTAAAAATRQFPAGTTVWQAACLNCHDTHTVPGARRLLREGTDSINSPKTGGNSAIEETCYQCHRDPIDPARIIGTSTGTVPNIKTEFERAVHMPIKTNDQGGGGHTVEEHDITNADFIETAANLGAGNTAKRHAECPDCHNPHRVIRNEL